MSVEDTKFYDSPYMRIDSPEWWAALEGSLGRNSEGYREAENFTRQHAKVKVELRDDLSLNNPGWAVIFENSDDWWALYFERARDAVAAAKEWTDATPKLSWRSYRFKEKPE